METITIPGVVATQHKTKSGHTIVIMEKHPYVDGVVPIGPGIKYYTVTHRGD